MKGIANDTFLVAAAAIAALLSIGSGQMTLASPIRLEFFNCLSTGAPQIPLTIPPPPPHPLTNLPPRFTCFDTTTAYDCSNLGCSNITCTPSGPLGAADCNTNNHLHLDECYFLAGTFFAQLIEYQVDCSAIIQNRTL
jgi:hypothetical protein